MAIGVPTSEGLAFILSKLPSELRPPQVKGGMHPNRLPWPLPALAGTSATFLMMVKAFAAAAGKGAGTVVTRI